MSSPSGATPVNGHDSSLAVDQSPPTANGDATDSDLSNVDDAEVLPSPDAQEEPNSVFHKPELTAEETYDDSGGEDDASADADFDMDDSPQSPQNDSENDEQSSSNGSRQASRRKATTGNEDDYMRENPELYGLRRSVCHPSFLSLTCQCWRANDADCVVTSHPATESCKLKLYLLLLSFLPALTL
jgi:chromodomain-helicase-DNA-binding protein 1